MRHTYTRADVELLAERFRTWGRWGDDDELGALNLVGPAEVLEAARQIQQGRVFSLALPMDRTGPQTGRGRTGRSNVQHFMARDGGDIAADTGDAPQFDGTDDLVVMYLQSSTQWDALAHAFYDGRMYNNRPTDYVTSSGAERNSVLALKERAVGRGVLLDVARWAGVDWLEPGTAIDSAELAACAEDQGVTVAPGDFVLVRTGQIAEVRARGSWDDYAGGAAPGLSIDAAEFLSENEVAAIACDTYGLDVRPFECDEVIAPLHVLLLVNAGVHIGEMWDLEDLATDCAADGRHTFFLSAPSLTITGAVGSPLNPIAVK